MSGQQASNQPEESIATTQTYIDAAQRGKNTWPRYLLGFLLVLFFGLVVGNIVVGLAEGVITAIPASSVPEGGIQGYVLLNSVFLFYLVGIVLAVALVHRRNLRTLITSSNHINLKRIAQGFGAWFLIMVGYSVVSFLLDPSIYWSAPSPTVFVLFALIALILTPIQTTTEELFFRGYLVQGASLISKTPVFLIIVSAVLFMLVHLGNPEVGAGFVVLVLFYLAWGVFLALVSLKDGTTELAIGIHAANNLFLALVVNFSGSALAGTPALFYTDSFDPVSELVSFVVMCTLFYLWILPLLKRRHSVGGRPRAT